MEPDKYLTVASFGNDTDKDITLYLEMMCEEVVLSPGHQIDLLAKPSPDLLPIAIHQVAEGMQVFPIGSSTRTGTCGSVARSFGRGIRCAWPTLRAPQAPDQGCLRPGAEVGEGPL